MPSSNAQMAQMCLARIHVDAIMARTNSNAMRLRMHGQGMVGKAAEFSRRSHVFPAVRTSLRAKLPFCAIHRPPPPRLPMRISECVFTTTAKAQFAARAVCADHPPAKLAMVSSTRPQYKKLPSFPHCLCGASRSGMNGRFCFTRFYVSSQNRHQTIDGISPADHRRISSVPQSLQHIDVSIPRAFRPLPSAKKATAMRLFAS